MKIPLSNRGMSHILLPLIIIVGVALLGVYLLVAVRADQPSSEFADINSLPKVVPELGVSGNGTAAITSVTNADGSVTSLTPNTLSTGPGGCIKLGNACYFWITASQPNIKAGGASVRMRQAEPKVGAHDYHSLAELWVGSYDRKQSIEIGWQTTHAHPKPTFWVYHSVNGKGTCYNGCGFVASGSVVGGPVHVGGVGTYGVEYNANSNVWYVLYNGSAVGWFPESLWQGQFKQIGQLSIYGEVAASQTYKSHTEMGNCKYGALFGSAYFSDLKFLNSHNKPDILATEVGTSERVQPYNYYWSSKTPVGIRYGGPGFDNTNKACVR